MPLPPSLPFFLYTSLLLIYTADRVQPARCGLRPLRSVLLLLLLTWLHDDDVVAGEGLQAHLVAGAVHAQPGVVELL